MLCMHKSHAGADETKPSQLARHNRQPMGDKTQWHIASVVGVVVQIL